MYYQLIIFIGECKNYEMLLCIKYLNRKGIEVRDGSSKKKKKKKKKKKNSIEFFGRRADLRAILTSIFLSWKHKNVQILKACTGMMWLR